MQKKMLSGRDPVEPVITKLRRDIRQTLVASRRRLADRICEIRGTVEGLEETEGVRLYAVERLNGMIATCSQRFTWLINESYTLSVGELHERAHEAIAAMDQEIEAVATEIQARAEQRYEKLLREEEAAARRTTGVVIPFPSRSDRSQ